MRRLHLAFGIPMAALALLAGGCGSDNTFPGDDGGITDAPVGEGGCIAPEQMCGSRCVNTQTDPMNCGSCGEPCPAGAFCQDGECMRTCTGTGMMACGSDCVDVSSDPDHCGECDNACAEDEMCSGGSCVCGDGATECGGACVDTDTSNEHCGLCDRACAADEICASGSCVKQNETECLDEMDNDEDGLTDCEDVEDCEGTSRDCDCPETTDTGVETCGSDGTWSECTGCAPPPDCTPGSGDCDYGFACVGGSCQFDPDATWDVYVLDGDIPRENLSGGSWDAFGGAPDPYVDVHVESLDGPSGSTDVWEGDDRFNPEWNQRVLLNIPGGQIKDFIRFDVYDSDIDANDFIGACVIRGLNDYWFGGPTRTVECPRDEGTGNAGFRVNFEIRRP